MAIIKTALIVGGGISGLCAAIALLRNGVAVDLVEKDKDWTVYGAGISLTGPTLRAFLQIGVLDQIKDIGFCHSGLVLRDGVSGKVLQKIEMPETLGEGVPGGGGIMRPALQKILVDAVADGGGNARLGVTVASYDDDGLGVDVQFTDGTNGRYDIVVGADGIASAMRPMLFPDAPSPVYSGQAVWRATAPRSPDIDCSNLFLLGNLKVGANPASKDLMYFFLTVNAPDNPRVEPGSHHILLADLMSGFGGPVKHMRETLNEDTQTLYRPFESVFVPGPWYRGRVILIGDAVHAVTPHLASGAGIAIEDAVVLAQVLETSATVPDAFAQFMERRFERCKMVLETSLQICAMEQAGQAEGTTSLVAQAMHKLAEPI